VQAALQNAEDFADLMDRYEKALIVYIKRISSADQDDAEDILQDVFIKTYRYLNSFDQDLKFSSWIYRIAHNEAISWHRKNKNIQTLSSEDSAAVFEKLASDLNLKERIDQKLTSEKIRQLVDKLDDKYRNVLILKFLEDKDYTEISDILKIPGGTVATLINRAKKKLKIIFKDHKITAEDL
jgi:RNA polymerase sigma-70 factor (ECF subfamily)